MTEAEIFSETIRAEMIRLLTETEPIPLDQLAEAAHRARKFFEQCSPEFFEELAKHEWRGPVRDGPNGAVE